MENVRFVAIMIMCLVAVISALLAHHQAVRAREAKEAALAALHDRRQQATDDPEQRGPAVWGMM